MDSFTLPATLQVHLLPKQTTTMEGLRHSLLAPAGGTVLILFSTIDSMKRMVVARYSTKDDGKLLFPVPYAPWTQVDPKYEDKAMALLRSFRAFENVKEWSFIGLPLMWIFSLYGGCLPYATEPMVEVATLGSALVYSIGNVMFSSGYLESSEGRIKAFKIRSHVIRFWLFGSATSLICGAWKRFVVIKA
jgi:hypothetical protein